MRFIPFKGNKQAYAYDDRPFSVKVVMWFWEHIGIPLMGRIIKGKTLQFEHIEGEKIKYINCTFKRCKFDGMKLVFILRSTIEHETPIPEFKDMTKCAIRNCIFRKVSPVIIGGKVKGAEA